MLAQTFQEASILRRLAQLEPGWHTSLDCAWLVTGPDSDYDARSDVLRLLGNLYDRGEIERLHVWSKNRPGPCYKVNPEHLEALATEAAS
jgi:hypothetical protein